MLAVPASKGTEWREITRATGHTGNVSTVRWSRAGLCTGGHDKLVVMWKTDGLAANADAAADGNTDPKALVPSANLVGHAWAVFAVDCATQDERTVVVSGSGIWDRRLMVWDPYIAGADDTMPPHFSEIVMGGCFYDGGRRFVSSGQNCNRTLQVWDTQTHERLSVLRNVDSLGCNPAVLADGTLLSSSNTRNIVVLEPVADSRNEFTRLSGDATLSSGNGSNVLQRLTGDGDVLALPGGRHLVLAASDSVVIVDAIDPEALPRTLPGASGRMVTACPSGKRVVVVQKQSANVFRLQPLQLLKKLVPPTAHTSRLYTAAYSPTGQHIALADHNSNVTVYDAASFQLVTQFAMWDPVYRLAFTPDGSCVVCGGDDKTIGVWDTFTGEALVRIYVGAGVGQVGVSLRGHVVAGDDLGRVLFLELKQLDLGLPVVTPQVLWEPEQRRWSARPWVTCPYSGTRFELPPPIHGLIKSLKATAVTERAAGEGLVEDERLVIESPEVAPDGAVQRMRVNPFIADLSVEPDTAELADELLAMLPLEERDGHVLYCVQFDSGKVAGHHQWNRGQVAFGCRGVEAMG